MGAVQGLSRSTRHSSTHARTSRHSVTLSNNLLHMSSLRSSRAKATFALVFAFSAFCLSQAAPGDVLVTATNFNVDGEDGGVSDRSSGHTCVTYTTELASASNDVFSGIISERNWQSWLNTPYDTVEEDIAALKTACVTNSVCDFSDFNDSSCSKGPIALDGNTEYRWGIGNRGTAAVTVRVATIKECTTAEVAQLGRSSSGSTRAIATVVLALIGALLMH